MLFIQMHYGVTNDLAAQCLLIAVGVGGLLVLLPSPGTGRHSLL